MRRYIYLFVATWLFSMPLIAQDAITEGTIGYGQTVSDNLTESAFFDQWRFQGRAGDLVGVQMVASDGLAPLIGILDSGGDLVARSDATEDGLVDALPDAIVELTYRIPEDAEYIIVPTRVGNENGTTTGSYALTLTILESTSSDGTMTADVTFRCGEAIVANALMFRFPISPNEQDYRISVYGTEDFQPHLRVSAGMLGTGSEFTDCSDDAQAMDSDEVIFPSGDVLSLTDDSLDMGAQYSLRGEGLQGWVQATVASPEGTSGRYMVFVEGLQLSEPEPNQAIEMRFGPLAKNTDLYIYMVGGASNRIDPLMYIERTGEELIICDDAGRRDCEDVPSFADSGVMFNDGEEILGDRFDAGLLLNLDHSDWIRIDMESRARNAYGEFALVFIGELPSS